MKKAILLTTVMAVALVGCEQANDAVDKASTAVTDAAKETVSVVEEKSADIVETVKEVTDETVEGVKDASANVVETAKETGSDLIDGAKDVTATVVDGTKDAASAAVDKTVEVVGDTAEKAKSVVTETVDETKEVIANVADGAKEKAAGAAAVVAGGLAAVSSKASSADLGKGKEVYEDACKLCHDSGMMGAPKLGNAADWTERMSQGMDTLNSNAINGIRGMPAKGGKATLSDEDVKAAVAYMLSKSH